MPRRTAAVLLAAATLATGTGGAVATAAESAPVLVTIHLASGPAAVAKLAGASGLTHTQRLDRLHAAVSDLGARRDVDAFLSGHGFTVTKSSPFVVHAEASRATVDATFPRGADGYGVAPALAGEASYVVTSDEARGMFKPLQVQPLVDGSGVRSLYGAPSGLPPAGHASPSIATIQFSGWDSGDLTTFAAYNGLADPVASVRYREVAVDGADPRQPDGTGGEIEVALDQESLLAAAPNAAQVVYFAPNSALGIIDAIEQVATDAYNGANIGALSVSYGMCEQGLPAAYLTAVHQALSDAVAAGVTVFAASGDEGAYACGPGNVSVNSPASDPLIVAVGGSTVDASGPTPIESVWWDGTNGSGGGTSGFFSEPSYQQATAPGLPGRGLPDITLDGDPASGLAINVDGLTGIAGGTSLASPLAAATFTDLLSSSGTDYGIGDIHRNLYDAAATDFRDITVGGNGAYQAGPGYDLASGLGAPHWSALQGALIGTPQVTAPAISRSRSIPISVTVPTGMAYDGWSTGVGPAPADCGKATSSQPPASIVAGADGTADIYVIGYTGTYCYVAHATTRIDSVVPIATATATRTGRRSATFAWHANDRAPSTGIAGYAVRVFAVGGSTRLFQQSNTRQKSFALRNGRLGTTYAVQVSAVDVAGNRSLLATARVRLS